MRLDSIINQSAHLRPSYSLKARTNTLAVAALAAAALLLLPIAAVMLIAAGGSGDVWPHLIRFVIPHSVVVTLEVLAMALCLSAIFGVGSAWFVAVCRFPGRGFFEWALILPLAVPSYVSAYYYTELMSYSGPMQSILRATFGFTSPRDYWFPGLNNVGGASFIFASVLYPYVYLTARVLFAEKARTALDSARLLGAGPWEVFHRVGLPMARPAIVVGLSLVAMEALNDIGAVDYLGVDMLALSVFDTWINRGSLAGAAQIALALMAFVILILFMESKARRAKILANRPMSDVRGPVYEMRGKSALGAITFCAIPIIAGFLIPVSLLVQSSISVWGDIAWQELMISTGHSLLIATCAAALCFIMSILMVGGARQSASSFVNKTIRLGSLGYAVPGTILGIGTLIVFANFDNWLDGMAEAAFGLNTGLLLTGSILGVVFACSVRFMAMTQGSMQSAISHLPASVDHAARTLGNSRWNLFREIHLPLLMRAGLAGSLLVFVDTLKELSATLVLIPFNFSTLATFLYEKASNAQVEEGSVAALAIVLAGLLPVIYVSKTLSRREHH